MNLNYAVLAKIVGLAYQAIDHAMVEIG